MILALVQLALSMSLVGANVIVGKLLAAALPVPVILLVRCLIGAVLLAPVVLPRDAAPPRGRMLLASLGQAVFGTLIYNSFLLAGLRRTGALQAGMVLAALPAVVTLGAAVLLRERLTARRGAGVLLAALGLFGLALARDTGEGGGSWAGNALVLLAVCGEASYVLLTRVMATRMDPVRATFWLQVAGAVVMAPFALPLLGSAGALGRPDVAALLLLHAATASVACNLLWFAGMRRAPASLAAVMGIFLPGTAAVLAIVLLGERLTPALAAALATMLASVLVATWPARPAREPLLQPD